MSKDETRVRDINLAEFGVCRIIADGMLVQSGGGYTLTIRENQAPNQPDSPIAALRWRSTEITHISGNAELTTWFPKEGDRFEATGESMFDENRDGSCLKMYGCEVTRVLRGGMYFSCQCCELIDKDGAIVKTYRIGPIGA